MALLKPSVSLQLAMIAKRPLIVCDMKTDIANRRRAHEDAPAALLGHIASARKIVTLCPICCVLEP